MPQFKFYINDSERKDLINYILSKGTKIIPALLYPTDKYITLSNTEEFFNHLKNQEIGFYLMDNSFELEPLVVSKNRFFEEPKFSIVQRKGGPYIDIDFYLGYADDAKVLYKCSIIDHYARFIHYDSYEEFRVSENLKDYYKDVIRFIKTLCKCVKKDGKMYWISKSVINELTTIE